MPQRMIQINEDRLLSDLRDLAQIGATAEGGVHRPALTEADLAGREWFRQSIHQAGLALQEDSAGNISAVLPSVEPNAKTLLLGSHLDTVPNGGRFDGALGVLAALEVLRTLADSHRSLPCHLEAISFTDEEGNWIPLLGSSAISGNLNRESFTQPRGSKSELAVALARAGISVASCLTAQRNLNEFLAYLEVHIEQGTRLESSALDIGIVTSIVGIRSHWLEFVGEAAHAGTKAVAERKDAFWGAADFVIRARELVLAHFVPGVVNCGILELQPGAFNIVPARVRMSLEFRHGTEKQLAEMEKELLALAEQCAARFDLTLNRSPVAAVAPAPMHSGVQATIAGAAEAMGLSHTRLMSFAGHDPQSFAHDIPTGMFFVPCRDGISHNPAEFTRDEDCIHAANVLLHSALLIAEGALA
ncbi:MAG: M20 family metallo-hydrolase [Anaerolineaceae bacterium]|nr:M20 family metallo-hydrolase [Anaerolineaceae bacterium]